MARDKNWDNPYRKVRYCDPGACHCCEDRGGGNFYCREQKCMVVENWESTKDHMSCKLKNADKTRRKDDGSRE